MAITYTHNHPFHLHHTHLYTYMYKYSRNVLQCVSLSLRSATSRRSPSPARDTSCFDPSKIALDTRRRTNVSTSERQGYRHGRGIQIKARRQALRHTPWEEHNARTYNAFAKKSKTRTLCLSSSLRTPGMPRLVYPSSSPFNPLSAPDMASSPVRFRKG